MSILRTLPLLVLIGAAPTPTSAQAEGPGRGSLEDLLGRYRARRDDLLAGARSRVEELLAAMESAVQGKQDERVEDLKRQLVALGPDCAPLLLPSLDPGARTDEPALRRSRKVAEALRDLPTAAVSPGLLELARTGTPVGKRNALFALRGSGEPERVGQGLRELYRDSTGELKKVVLVTLAHLGGAANDEFVGGLLLHEDQEVRRNALEAAAGASSLALAPRVLEFLRTGTVAARHVNEVLAYYQACPQALDAEHCAGILRLAREGRLADPEAVRLVEFLGSHKNVWSNDLRRELRDMVGASPREVETAVLVVLSKGPSPDARARRQLLDPYDQEVDRRRDNWVGYRNRGDIKLRIEDYKGALRDYQDAIKYSRDSLRPDASPHVGLARVHARTGKLRDASLALERAPLTRTQLQALAKDPDFVELAASRFGKILE